MSAGRPGSLVDYGRACCLSDAGQPNYFAAVCVSADGTDALWLVSNDELAAEHPRCGSADQPHELDGPLPPRWAARVALAPLRCGRRTRAGGRCRVYVTHPGEPCVWHRSGART
jgi:hypothetical protein